MRSALSSRVHRRVRAPRNAETSTRKAAKIAASAPPSPLGHRRSTSTSTSATADSSSNDCDQQPPPLTIIPEAPPAALDVEAEALAPEQLLNATGGGGDEAAAAAAAAASSSSPSAAGAFEVPSLSSPSGSAAFAPPETVAAESPPPPPQSPSRPPSPPRDSLRPLRWLSSLLSPDKGAPAPPSVPSSSPSSSPPSRAASASASSPPTSFSTVTLSTDSDDEGVAASAAATAAAAAAAGAAATATVAGPPPSYAPVNFEAAAAFGGGAAVAAEGGETSYSSSSSASSASSANSSPLSVALPPAAVVTPPLIAEAPDVPAATANAAVASSSAAAAGKGGGASAGGSGHGGATSSAATGAVADAGDQGGDAPDLGSVWGLGVLGLLYVHHSTTGFALPALLPLISPDLSLSDVQGSLLTAGYTVLYALALIPVGLLADRADRPRMLAGGAALWSLATIAASRAQGFGELLALRVAFAAAQATQNPICFSLIPELFPRERNTAMAAYNAAIYVGRALSFAAVIVAGRLGMGNVSAGAAKGAGDAAGAAASAAGAAAGSVARNIGVTMVPLDKLDLSQVSLLYTQGERKKNKGFEEEGSFEKKSLSEGSKKNFERKKLTFSPTFEKKSKPLSRPKTGNMAAITPIYDYDFTILHNVVIEASWRQLLFWLGPPGLVVAALALLTLDEPRKPGSAPSGDPFASSKFINPATRAMSRSRGDSFVERGAAARAKAGGGGGSVVSVAPVASAALPPSSSVAALVATDPKPSAWESVRALCSSRAFQAITAAAAINDVGSWSLVAFQATFYQRVYELGPETYAPALAIILPIGGILGGVGGGLLADGAFFSLFPFRGLEVGGEV